MNLSSASVVCNALRLPILSLAPGTSKASRVVGLLFVTVLLCIAFPRTGTAQGRCPSAQPQVQVDGKVEEIRELTDVTLAELADAARRRKATLRHPLIGAYTETVGFELNIDDTVTNVEDGLQCVTPRIVFVRLTMLNRIIHLPKDFAADSCLLELSRSHARKHAMATYRVFEGFVKTYPEELRVHLTALAVRPARSELVARAHMTIAIRDMVKEELDRYARAQVSQGIEAVDTPEEIARLRDACGGSLRRLHGVRVSA